MEPTNSEICSHCNKRAEWKHLHDCAYGMEGTHMSGSERYQCQRCKKSLYAIEGKAHGMNFFCD